MQDHGAARDEASERCPGAVSCGVHRGASASSRDARVYHRFPRFPTNISCHTTYATSAPTSATSAPTSASHRAPACGPGAPVRAPAKRRLLSTTRRRRRPKSPAPVAGGPISRVLSEHAAQRRTRLIISLGRASPRASSGRPGDGSGPGKPFLPIGPCTRWGLPSCPCYHGHWCALTAPFHPYPSPIEPRGPVADTGGLLSVARAVALRAQPLAGTLPYGARTFLEDGVNRPRDQVAHPAPTMVADATAPLALGADGRRIRQTRSRERRGARADRRSSPTRHGVAKRYCVR